MPDIQSYFHLLRTRAVAVLLMPSLAFLLLLLGTYVVTTGHIDWSTWRPATCMPDACFCEAVAAGTVRQSANTWSSLAFAWVGFIVLGLRWEDRRTATARPNLMAQGFLYSWVFATAIIAIGLGSAFYHASLTFMGQFFDVFGMYLIGTFVIVYNIGRRHQLRPVSAAVLYLGMNAVLAIVLWEVPALRRYLFAGLIAIALWLEWRARSDSNRSIDFRYMLGSLGALALAFAIWIVDITRIACAPESLIQGHAAWHVLGAVSSGLLYLYYRSEILLGEPTES